MAKKLGDFLKDLLTKAGVDLTKDELKKVLEMTDEIPDDVAETASKALIAVSKAHEHPDVLKAAKGPVLNAIDKKINDVMTELELEGDDDFKGEKNTYEKIAKLTKLANAAGLKKSGATGAKDKTEWADKEAAYNVQLKELKQKLTDQETTFTSTRKNDNVIFNMREILGGKQYALPAEMATKLKVSTALGAIQAEATSRGFSITEDEHGNIVLVNKDGTPAYDTKNNVPLEANTFFDGVLAQQKLLVVSGKQNPGAGGAGGAGEIIPGDVKNGNAQIASEIAAEFTALQSQASS